MHPFAPGQLTGLQESYTVRCAIFRAVALTAHGTSGQVVRWVARLESLEAIMVVTELPGPHCGFPCPTPPGRNVAEQAERLLRGHACLALKNIACDYSDGVLT